MKFPCALCFTTLVLVCCSSSKNSSSPGSGGGPSASGGASAGSASGGTKASGGLDAGQGGANSGAPAGGGSASGASGGVDGGDGGDGGAGGDSGAGGERGSDDCAAAIDSDGNIEAPCVGVHGHWYLLADSLGPNGAAPGTCQSVGMHPDSECSQPELFQFLPIGNDGAVKVCTSGTVAKVGLLDGESDFTNQWGAAIGFDFAASPDVAMTFDAAAAGVRGVAFEIDNRPLPGLRVEFYDASTAGGQDAAYWGATDAYPSSPVRLGGNEITWDQVGSPLASVPDLDTTHLVRMVFHVPAYSGSSATYQFCIGNVRLLR